MASTDYKPEAKHVAAPAADDVPVSDAPPPAASSPEKGAAPPPPPPELKTETPRSYVVVAEVVLRVLLFVGTVTAVVVMVTSKETELVPIPFPPFRILNSSRFTDSPAFVYFVAALSVAGLYSIISTLATGLALLKPGSYKQLVSHFVVIDVLLLGIVAAATGAAAGVAYIGLKGNSHSRWSKICNRYDTFCQHLAGSIAASLFASIVLVLLILLSVFTLSRKKRD